MPSNQNSDALRQLRGSWRIVTFIGAGVDQYEGPEALPPYFLWILEGGEKGSGLGNHSLLAATSP